MEGGGRGLYCKIGDFVGLILNMEILDTNKRCGRSGYIGCMKLHI